LFLPPQRRGISTDTFQRSAYSNWWQSLLQAHRRRCQNTEACKRESEVRYIV